MSLLAGLSQQGDSIAAHNSDPAAHLNWQRRAITANLTLTAADSPQQNVSSDAARDINLPAESTAQWHFHIHNYGNFALTVKRAGGTTVATLSTGYGGGSVLVSYDGTLGFVS